MVRERGLRRVQAGRPIRAYGDRQHLRNVEEVLSGDVWYGHAEIWRGLSDDGPIPQLPHPGATLSVA